MDHWRALFYAAFNHSSMKSGRGEGLNIELAMVWAEIHENVVEITGFGDRLAEFVYGQEHRPSVIRIWILNLRLKDVEFGAAW